MKNVGWMNCVSNRKDSFGEIWLSTWQLKMLGLIQVRLDYSCLTLHPAIAQSKHNNVLYGKVPPRGPNPYLLHTTFGTPLVYLLLTNGTPFTYLVLTFASLLTAVNALSLWCEQISNQNVLSTFLHKMQLQVLLGFFTDENDRSPYPFIYFNSEFLTFPPTWSLKRILL